MPNNENFTVESIASLPIRKISYGGQQVDVRYDKEKKIIYQLDRSGNYTGKWGYVDLDAPKTTPAGPSEPSQETSPDALEGSSMQESIADTEQEPSSMEPLDLSSIPDEPDATPVPDNRPKPETLTDAAAGDTAGNSRKKLAPYQKGIAIVAALAVTAFLLNVLSAPRKKQDPESSTTTSATELQAGHTTAETQASAATTTAPEPTQTEATQPPTEPGVTVLTATKDLIPGHRITRNDLSTSEISRQDYQLLQAMGGLYTESDAQNLIGLEAAAFIAKGTYIDHDDLTVSYLPVSPWGRTDQQQYKINLPVTVTAKNLADYLPGTQADITIVTETTVTGALESATEPTESSPNGTEHNTTTVESTIINTYVIRSALCIDILDKKQNSLYPAYAALTAIPSPYLSRMIKKTCPTIYHVEQMIPAYISIAVTAEQAAMIQDLLGGKMVVTVSNPAGIAENKAQADNYQQLRNVAACLANQWAAFTGGGN